VFGAILYAGPTAVEQGMKTVVGDPPGGDK